MGILKKVIVMRLSRIVKKNGAIMVFGGIAYGIIEMLWRGRTHWTMIVTGSFCFTLLNKIYKKYAYMMLIKKCVLGGAVITACEFLCGMIVNVKFKMKVWDYSKYRFNIKGQICPLYSFLWTLLCLPICAICRLINRKERAK